MVHPLHRADARLGDLVRGIIRDGPVATLLVRSTTDFGSLFMVIPAAAGLLRQRQARTAAEVTAAGMLGWTVSQSLKNTVERKRPYEAEGIRRLIPPPVGSSMPSGHAAVATAVATVLADGSRPGRRWPWAIMAAYVPVTRVHLGVHYPSDTAVGSLLGYGLGQAVIAGSRAGRSRRARRGGRGVLRAARWLASLH